MTPPFTISTDPAKLDMRWVITTLRASYWGEWLTPIQIMRACDHSLCFGAYVAEPHLQAGRQIGIGRFVTDRATFSSLTDLAVDEMWQRKGVGTAIMRAALDHPHIKTTICILSSRDARDFYAKFGFLHVGGQVMKRAPHA
jgi:GNAT superfamily N-acetyltransferase